MHARPPGCCPDLGSVPCKLQSYTWAATCCGHEVPPAAGQGPAMACPAKCCSACWCPWAALDLPPACSPSLAAAHSHRPTWPVHRASLAACLAAPPRTPGDAPARAAPPGVCPCAAVAGCSCLNASPALVVCTGRNKNKKEKRRQETNPRFQIQIALSILHGFKPNLSRRCTSISNIFTKKFKKRCSKTHEPKSIRKIHPKIAKKEKHLGLTG